jgi:hypothetical protein
MLGGSKPILEPLRETKSIKLEERSTLHLKELAKTNHGSTFLVLWRNQINELNFRDFV